MQRFRAASVLTSLTLAVVPCARELGVGIVAYSPLCRGLLTGTIDPSALPATDRRSINPRFTADNFSANMAACAAPLASIAGELMSSCCVLCWRDLMLLSDQRLHGCAAGPGLGSRAGRRCVPDSWY